MANKQSTSIRALYGKTEDRYLELVRAFPLRPLRNEADLNAAIAVIDMLIDKPQLSLPEQDYLDVLGDLVEAYEDESIPMRPVGDAETLHFLIEQKGITQAQAASGAGVAPATISEVLAGKRNLTRLQVGKLAKFFHVKPGVFQ